MCSIVSNYKIFFCRNVEGRRWRWLRERTEDLEIPQIISHDSNDEDMSRD